MTKKLLFILIAVLSVINAAAVFSQEKKTDLIFPADEHIYRDRDVVKTITFLGTVHSVRLFSHEYKNLEKIILKDGISTIESNAFWNLKSLETVEFPQTLTDIGSYAFYNTSIENIKLPDSLKTIGNNCFAFCLSLESVSLPKKINMLSPLVFQSCSALEKITLPDSLKTIGTQCFSHCRNLKIKIPKNVYSIGGGAFNCIEKLTIDSKNKNFTLYNGVLFNKDKTVLISMVNEKDKFVIPESVETIAPYAFSGTKLENVIISSNVKVIGNNAFSGTNIQNITIPSNVKEIGNNAFYGCDNLTSVLINEGVEKIGDSAFAKTKIKTVFLPDTVNEIGADIAENFIISEENDNFVTKDDVKFNEYETVLVFYPKDKKDTEYKIPDGVEKANDGVKFNNYVKKLVFPATFTDKVGFLKYMENLEEVEVDENNPNICVIDGVLYSKDKKELFWMPKNIKLYKALPELRKGIEIKNVDKAFLPFEMFENKKFDTFDIWDIDEIFREVNVLYVPDIKEIKEKFPGYRNNKVYYTKDSIPEEFAE